MAIIVMGLEAIKEGIKLLLQTYEPENQDHLEKLQQIIIITHSLFPCLQEISRIKAPTTIDLTTLEKAIENSLKTIFKNDEDEMEELIRNL